MTREPGWQIALAALSPLEVTIEAALARGDGRGALQHAYHWAMQAAEMLAPEEASTEGLTAVHGVWVELMPLAAQGDGTLVDCGAHVSLEYQCCELTEDEAVALAVNLATRLTDSHAEWGTVVSGQ